MSTWPTNPPVWTTQLLSILSTDVSTTTNTNLKTIMEKSIKFPIQFPKLTITCQQLIKTVPKDTLEKNIQSVYPVLHEYSLFLCAKFLLFKRENGTNIEKHFYKNMSVEELIDRLLKKRAVSFIQASDAYLLMDGTRGYGAWESIGRNFEKPPLILENYLSYDEIKLSALLSVSSYTYFINDGNRFNKGEVAPNRDLIQETGIIIGLIGTRLEKENVMEYQEIVITPKQNTKQCVNETCLPRLFADFYENEIYAYGDERLLHNKKFTKLADGTFFDNEAYSKRMALSFDTLLMEANYRAKVENKMAYVHVVGLGLGVWKLSIHQTKIFMKCFLERLRFLGSSLANVSDVHFAYISGADCIAYKDGDLFSIEGHPNKGVKLHISKREPHTKLKDEGKLLIVSYAWDGNALPGNEFWIGMFTASGDCAAAASTQIAELHNPHINNLVSAANLMIATLTGDVIPFNEYLQKIQINPTHP